MTEKIKVSREVAEAIEYLLSHKHYEYTKEKLLTTHAKMEKYPKRSWADEANPLNDIDLLVLAEILVNGYEVELTPHEKVREFVEGYQDIDDFSHGIRVGITEVLDMLNIKIEGVNT